MFNNNQEHEYRNDEESPIVRDIHALNPPSTGHRSSPLSIASSSSTSGENFTTISREFNALVLAGSMIRTESHNLGRIGEEQNLNEETNPLAIVLDRNLLETRRDGDGGGEGMIKRVKKEETEAKISAWENAKIAKINNRFKREEVIIHSWENKQVEKASSWMKEVERKMEKKRAKAVEKMENDIAKARRKAEERKASAEAKKGTKMAKMMEIANSMRAMGKAPSKCSCFY